MKKNDVYVLTLIIAFFAFVLCGCEKKNAQPSLVEQCVEVEAYVLNNERVTLKCIDEYRYDERVYVELQYDAIAIGKTLPIDFLFVAYDQEDLVWLADFPLTADFEGMFADDYVYYQAFQIAREQGEHTHYSKEQFQKFLDEAIVRREEKKGVEDIAGTD